jgi:hypothetical protein
MTNKREDKRKERNGESQQKYEKDKEFKKIKRKYQRNRKQKE